MRLQRVHEHRAMPWANGRGTSLEVARGGCDDWSWRVAIAPVVEDGPFSVLPGVDRWLVVMDDAPLNLVVDGAERTARRGEVVAFAGESTVTANLPAGPTRDCGLMVRRSRASGSMWVAGTGPCEGSVLIAVTDARVRAEGAEIELATGDALVGDIVTCCIDVLAGSVAVVRAGSAESG